MSIETWLNLPQTVKKSQKGYAHFDDRTDLSKCRDYVTDPQKIATHSFYPFIHYEQKWIKYNKDGNKSEKKRDICYAAHIDRCIFQYYNHILNELYNVRIRENGLYEVPIAYRTDLHMNTAELAKKAIDFIRAQQPCYVMIGDFTGFFDNLDHQYLKRQICSLLGVEELPEDYYAVFKNLTRYSKWELTDLLQLNGLEDTQKGRHILNSKCQVLTRDQYKSNRSHIEKNKKPFGIPQGSPISALFANVYMLDVDKYINELVSAHGGMYMRYSDDFIIVLPQMPEQEAVSLLLGITQYLNNTPGLTLKNEKTQYFCFGHGDLTNCGERFHKDSNSKKRFINFLGFTFDGDKVSVRSKTVIKYYYMMNRKARTIVRNGGYSRKGNKISAKNLYQKYSIRGAHSGRGNFLTYIERCQNVFGTSENIDRDTRRHMQKIRQALRFRVRRTSDNEK